MRSKREDKMTEDNIKEDTCKAKAFSLGMLFGILIVLILAWDKIIYYIY